MDKASLIGSIFGVVVCGATVMLVVSHGGNLMMFWSLKGVIMDGVKAACAALETLLPEVQALCEEILAARKRLA